MTNRTASSRVASDREVPVSQRHGVRSWILDPIVCYYALMATVLILTAFGLVMVFSSSSVDLIASGSSPFDKAITQGVFALIGLVVAIIATRLPVALYRKASFVVLFISWMLQLLTLTPLAVAVGGNTGWIVIAGIQFQPAEIIKLALCLWVPAAIVSARKRGLGNIKAYLVPCVGVVVSFGVVLVGKDLGTGLILLLIGVAALFLGGINWKFLLVAGVVLVSGVVGMFVIGSSNRMSRILASLSGCTDTAQAQGVCYQTIHGRYALASGGWTGVGLGASREKWNYLPEAHNDFIFAVIGEELGFIGAIAVVLCFVVIGWSLVVIALKHQDSYAKVVLSCVAVWVVGQAFINVLVVLQVLPVIGLPLPFVSAGGTALIISLVAIGVSVRMAREQTDIARVIGTRRRLRRNREGMDGKNRGSKQRGGKKR